MKKIITAFLALLLLFGLAACGGGTTGTDGGTTGSGGDTPAPNETSNETPNATPDGTPSATPGGTVGSGSTQPPGGDGKTKLTYAELLALQPQLNTPSMRTSTYAQVVEFLGGIEGHLQTTNMENRWKYFWYASNGGKLEVIFDATTGLYYTSNMYDASWG